MATTIPITLPDGQHRALTFCSIDDVRELEAKPPRGIDGYQFKTLREEMERADCTQVCDLGPDAVLNWQKALHLYVPS
jgi:hypothetical protein